MLSFNYCHCRFLFDWSLVCAILTCVSLFDRSITICSDSQVVLKSIAAAKMTSHLVWETAMTLQQLCITASDCCGSTEMKLRMQTIFQSVIMAKLLYASSAWSGFATAARTVSELTHFSAEASDGVSVARTHPRSRYCWRTVINSCFARS